MKLSDNVKFLPKVVIDKGKLLYNEGNVRLVKKTSERGYLFKIRDTEDYLLNISFNEDNSIENYKCECSSSNLCRHVVACICFLYKLYPNDTINDNALEDLNLFSNRISYLIAKNDDGLNRYKESFYPLTSFVSSYLKICNKPFFVSSAINRYYKMLKSFSLMNVIASIDEIITEDNIDSSIINQTLEGMIMDLSNNYYIDYGMVGNIILLAFKSSSIKQKFFNEMKSGVNSKFYEESIKILLKHDALTYNDALELFSEQMVWSFYIRYRVIYIKYLISKKQDESLKKLLLNKKSYFDKESFNLYKGYFANDEKMMSYIYATEYKVNPTFRTFINCYNTLSEEEKIKNQELFFNAANKYGYILSYKIFFGQKVTATELKKFNFDDSNLLFNIIEKDYKSVFLVMIKKYLDSALSKRCLPDDTDKCMLLLLKLDRKLYEDYLQNERLKDLIDCEPSFRIEEIFQAKNNSCLEELDMFIYEE